VDHFCKIGTIDVTIQCYLQSVIVDFSQIATCQHELVVHMFGVPKNVFPLMVLLQGFHKNIADRLCQVEGREPFAA
jgi:hypothetical protein